jgi:large subunit ribosomal protein L4
MKVKVQGSSNSVEFGDATFGARFNEPLVHQVVTACLAGQRAGTKAQKNRSDVRGGGAKPWRQKGTGRARAGTSRSPLWTGGGATFAARPRDFSQKVNRKMYRAAMRSVLSELLRQERLLLVETFAIETPKTKTAIARLNELGVERGLIVVEAFDENLWLATRNLPNIFCLVATELDPLSLVGSDKVIMTTAAARLIEERLG